MSFVCLNLNLPLTTLQTYSCAADQSDVTEKDKDKTAQHCLRLALAEQQEYDLASARKYIRGAKALVSPPSNPKLKKDIDRSYQTIVPPFLQDQFTYYRENFKTFGGTYISVEFQNVLTLQVRLPLAGEEGFGLYLQNQTDAPNNMMFSTNTLFGGLKFELSRHLALDAKFQIPGSSRFIFDPGLGPTRYFRRPDMALDLSYSAAYLLGRAYAAFNTDNGEEELNLYYANLMYNSEHLKNPLLDFHLGPETSYSPHSYIEYRNKRKKFNLGLKLEYELDVANIVRVDPGFAKLKLAGVIPVYERDDYLEYYGAFLNEYRDYSERVLFGPLSSTLPWQGGAAFELNTGNIGIFSGGINLFHQDTGVYGYLSWVLSMGYRLSM